VAPEVQDRGGGEAEFAEARGVEVEFAEGDGAEGFEGLGAGGVEDGLEVGVHEHIVARAQRGTRVGGRMSVR